MDLVHDRIEKKESGESGPKGGPGVWGRLKDKTTRLLAAAAIGTALSAGACSDEFGAQLPPLQDAGEDSGSGGDGGFDGGGGDGGMDAGLDADAGDGGSPVDAGPDSGDAGPTACGSVMPAAPWTGLISTGNTKTHGGYDFTYLGPDVSLNAVFDIGCEGMLRYDNYAFPEDIVTTLNVAIDGRAIKVTPHSVGAQTQVTLEVQ